MWKNWFVFIYGIALIILGVQGYSQGSKVSLYSGGSFGLLLALSAILMFKQIKWGTYLAIAISVALTAVFSIRYSATGKHLPLILAVISAALFLTLLGKRVTGNVTKRL